MASERCFHCHEPVPPGLDLSVPWQGEDRPMCCPGCQAVAELILSSGQGDYYRFREKPAEPVDQALLDRLSDWDAFDDTPGLAAREGLACADVLVEGVRCAACGWLIEQQLGRLPGFRQVELDLIDRELRLSWDPEQASLADALRCLAQLGYRPHPAAAESRRRMDRSERQQALRRLGVAGLGMMQVMMVAAGTWFAEPGTIDPGIHRFLDLVAMLVATPVVLYSGAPFFHGALTALAAGRVNVDVPVALALGLAYGASCRNLLAGSGTVYFDSVSMFVFFLLLGRYVEMAVRQRSLSLNDALTRLLPETALRCENGRERPVPRLSLSPDDHIRVRHGDVFPCDGIVIEGKTEVDEAILSGESLPLGRGTGDRVLAGSANRGPAVTVRVTAVGEDLGISHLQRLVRRARGQRPPAFRAADRIASYLVFSVLVLAVVAWGLWLPRDADQAFEALLAVLVVTCPCAFSLATPSALAAATVQLGRQGLLVFSAAALPTLGRVTRVVFDKTGTLTRGRPAVRVECRAGEDAERVLGWAAALERGVAHPIARALQPHDRGWRVDDVEAVAGAGVRGRIEGRTVVLGHAAFVGLDEEGIDMAENGLLGSVWLSVDGQVLARLDLDDELRDDAVDVCQELSSAGVRCALLSGDQPQRVERAARAVGAESWQARLSAEDKLEQVRQWQQAGDTVMAVGDGVNDAPVLAGADVSVALGSGAGLAHSGADLLLPGERLAPLTRALTIGRRCNGVIRQNLVWALTYNAAAVPLAALGVIRPWMAAIGMSLSSLMVVLNAARLSRRRSSTAAWQALEARR